MNSDKENHSEPFGIIELFEKKKKYFRAGLIIKCTASYTFFILLV